MRAYDFSKRGKISLYEYLYECLKKDILEGRIAAGEKLPSKREMALLHDISVKTVENAYGQLIAEGYLEAMEKRGYFAAKVSHENYHIHRGAWADDGNRKKGYKQGDSGQENRPEACGSRGTHSKDCGESTCTIAETKWKTHEGEKAACRKAPLPCFADFTSSNTTTCAKFPLSRWNRVMRETLSSQDVLLLQTAPFQGVEKLRREIAAYLSRNRGMEVDPECILVGAGTEYLYGRLLRLLHKERYAVEDPGYRKIARIYRDSGAECCYIPVDESGICTEKLRESGAEVVHVSPGYHFPLGTVMPIARRQELLAWASEAPGRYIVEDDYDCEFRYSGRPIPSIQSMDRQQRVIYLNTFNKTLSPALRVGYMVLPEPLMARYEQSMNYYSNTVSSFEQFALAEFMEKGYFERHISRMRKYYREYRERIRLILKESGLPISKTGGDEAGTRILVELATTLSDAQIKQEAAKAGIKLECLSEFCQERKELFAHTLILNYADMDEAVLKEAIGRLAHIFSK